MKTNKILYRVFILAAFVLVNAGILYGISQIIAYLNTGADRSKMLHLDVARGEYYLPDMNWQSIANPGRPLEQANQTKIENDYLDAWYVKNTALFTQEPAGIYDHYTSSARKKLLDLIDYNAKNKVSIQTTTLSHHLNLEFYSADGKLAVLTDRNVTGIEQVYQNDQLLQKRNFNDDYRIILLLEDGFWRIRHFEKLNIHDPEERFKTVAVEPQLIEGINYYPQESPWDTFGENFDPEVIAADFEIIRDLKLNTIRIFIGYEDFGKATVSEEKLQKLHLLLDEAKKAGLDVIVTLFDFYGNYDITDYTLTNKHLTGIVTAVKEHPALAAWDIKNEPDLDFENRGKQRVLFWLSQTLSKLKRLDPDHPVTIGWSSPDTALELRDEVDIISYHYYKDLEGLAAAHQDLKKQTSKPLVLQEIGISSYHGFWNPLGATEEGQEEFYEQFFKTQKRDSINYLSWTLYDFREIPERVAGMYPWRTKKQAFFGLINPEGVKGGAYFSIKNR